MAALVWGVALVGLAFLVHVAWWRLCLPRRQTRALLLIFLGCGAGALLGLRLLGPRDGVPWPRTAADYVQIGLLVLAFAAAYVITYSAVEADSPTLVLVRVIAAAGPEGLPEADLYEKASDDVLVTPRVADLVRDGMLQLDGGRYHLTGKGRRFVRIFICYRWLLGAGKGG